MTIERRLPFSPLLPPTSRQHDDLVAVSELAPTLREAAAGAVRRLRAGVLRAGGLRACLLACLLAGAAGAQQADAGNRSLIRPAAPGERAGGGLATAFDRARPGVVHVFVEVAGRNTFKIERPSSGVLVDATGLVVTQWSLVAEAIGAGDKSLRVQRPGATPVPAELVARDADTGLALLRVEAGPAVREAALTLRGTRPRPGETVGVLGFHGGEQHTGFAGVATPAQGPVEFESGGEMRRLPADDLLLTDAAIQVRSHGAALLDHAGRVAGICSAARVFEPVKEPTLEQLQQPSFGFVVPADVIRRVFDAELPAAADGPAEPEDHVAELQRAAASVVGVVVGDPEPLGADDPFARQRRRGVGSGVVVAANGLVLTDAHLVEDAPAGAVAVRGGDGQRWPARVLSTHAPTNSALLALELAADERLAAIACARASELRPGQTLFALGRPQGAAVCVSAGVLSAVRGKSSLQTDTHLGNDNAGGALLDARGRLVGLVDGGRVDKVVAAFRRRGERAKVDDSLHRTPGLPALRDVHDEALRRGGGSDAPLFDPVAAASVGGPLADTVAATAGAMLNIYIERVVRGAAVDDNPFAPQEESTRVVSLGSGVCVDPHGLALTNWHVVDAATESDGAPRADHVVRARSFDGEVYDVTVLSISREEDLALLRLELEADQQVPAVELGRSAALRVGDRAIAIGNPLGQANSVTAGVITARDQSIRVRGRWAKLPRLLETDAAINSGNSGGALLDAAGRLIGINSAGGSTFNVTGYAIAVDHVRERLQSLLLGPHKMRSVYLGINVVDRDPGLEVFDVDPRGPAARAGVRQGDRLLSLDGVPVSWSVGYALRRLQLDAVDEVRVGLRRDGAELSVDLLPLSRDVWAVQRQLGVDVGTLDARDDVAAVREAATAFYRAYTGDSSAVPRRIPRSLVRVLRVHPTHGDDPVLQPGDLLLGVQQTGRIRSGTAGEIVRFHTPADLRRCFQERADYEGTTFRTWIQRDGAVQQVELVARRLLP